MKHCLGPQNKEEERIFAEEAIVFDFQELMCEAMKKCGVTNYDLAMALKVSPEEVQRLLEADANPTLKQVALIFHALRSRIEFTFVEK